MRAANSKIFLPHLTPVLSVIFPSTDTVSYTVWKFLAAFRICSSDVCHTWRSLCYYDHV
jgi:hypothetical protein